MLIHTLGPETTDSYAAAMHIPGFPKPKLQLHDSFDAIIARLHDYRGDGLLIPAAYQSAQADFGWRELCYEYSDRLELVTLFHRPLLPMCLLADPLYTEDAAVIHPATANLMRHSVPGDYPLVNAPSKAAAYAQFKAIGYRYTIVSSTMVEDQSQIIKTFTPDMVWCLYRIN